MGGGRNADVQMRVCIELTRIFGAFRGVFRLGTGMLRGTPRRLNGRPDVSLHGPTRGFVACSGLRWAERPAGWEERLAGLGWAGLVWSVGTFLCKLNERLLLCDAP